MNIKEITEMVISWVVAFVVFYLTGTVFGFLLCLLQSSQGNYKDGSWRSWAEYLIGFGLSWLVAMKILYAIYPDTVEKAPPSNPRGDDPGTSGSEVSSASGRAPRGQGLPQGGEIHPRP